MKVEDRSMEKVRQEILDAAEERFRRFGFGKTTMAEIARDCDMSAGNLYRYYVNKTEIGAGCAERCMRETVDSAREILRRPDLGAKERLRTFVLFRLKAMHEQFAAHPPLLELVLHISEERADLVQNHWQNLQSVVAEILAEGKRSGEFNVDDIVAEARAVLLAVYKFISPRTMVGFSLKELEEEAEVVLRLVIRALGAA